MSSSGATFASDGWRRATTRISQEIPALHRLVMAGKGQQWDAAKDLATEMMKRFDQVLVDTPTMRAHKASLAVPAAVS